MCFESEPDGTSVPVAGIVVAVVSSLFNGSSFVLQRKGILRARNRGGSEFTDVVWLTGTLSMVVGQIGNFLAYNKAPAVTVSLLGVLGLLFGAVLASWILEEHLNILGKLGCLLCCCGAVVIIIHTPEIEAVKSGQEFEKRLSDPVFVLYALLVVLLLVILIVWIAPAHGSSNVMVYVAICSLLGSFTVLSSKGLWPVARDICKEDQEESSRALTLFLILLGTLAVSILIQFFFIKKASEHFSSHTFEAIYYVTFTFTVSLASALFFKQFTALTIISNCTFLCGLATVCVGVALLHNSQEALLTSKKKTD